MDLQSNESKIYRIHSRLKLWSSLSSLSVTQLGLGRWGNVGTLFANSWSRNHRQNFKSYRELEGRRSSPNRRIRSQGDKGFYKHPANLSLRGSTLRGLFVLA